MPMLPSMDRFSQGLPDPQEASVACYCEGCGREIYEGEDIWWLNDSSVIHADLDCLKEYYDPQLIPIEEALKP